jgi:hypothetical protein
MANGIPSRTHECPYCPMGADNPTKEQFDAHMKTHNPTQQAVEKTKEKIEVITASLDGCPIGKPCKWCNKRTEQLLSLIDEEKAKAYQSGMSKGYINGRTSLQKALVTSSQEK